MKWRETDQLWVEIPGEKSNYCLKGGRKTDGGQAGGKKKKESNWVNCAVWPFTEEGETEQESAFQTIFERGNGTKVKDRGHQAGRVKGDTRDENPKKKAATDLVKKRKKKNKGNSSMEREGRGN